MKHWKQIMFICCIIGILATLITACATKRSNTQTDSAPANSGEIIGSSAEIKEALDLYKKILHNEMYFYDENNDVVYFQDLNTRQFAVLDMNMYKDGIPELVLHNTSNGDTFVLHCFNGVAYGKNYGYRAMKNLKKAGFFEWSNSAFNSGIDILHITERDQEIIHLAEYGSLLEQIEMYRIRGNPVSQAEFNDYSAFQYAKDDVVWHELTIENINNLAVPPIYHR